MHLWIAYGVAGATTGPAVVACVRYATCGHLARRIPVRRVRSGELISVSVFCGAVLAVFASRLQAPAVVPAWSWLALGGTTLALVDLRCHRLPRGLVGALFAGGVVLLGYEASAGDVWSALVRALLAAAVVFIVGVAVALLLAPRLGFGDVTLSAAVSLFLGWSSWSHVVQGLLAAIVLCGLASVALLVAGRVGPGDPIALGPGLIAGPLLLMLLRGA